MEIVEKLVFRLFPARILDLQEQYKGRPYGDVSMRVRLAKEMKKIAGWMAYAGTCSVRIIFDAFQICPYLI